MNGGIQYAQLADALAEYRAATAFLRVDNSHTHLHQQAVDIITQTGHVFYETDCDCLVCGNEFTQLFPLSVIASWAPQDKPRGVCDRCNAKTTAEAIKGRRSEQEKS